MERNAAPSILPEAPLKGNVVVGAKCVASKVEICKIFVLSIYQSFPSALGNFRCIVGYSPQN
jgi:hypothetical protein